MLEITVYHPTISLQLETMSCLDYFYDVFSVSTLMLVCLVSAVLIDGLRLRGKLVFKPEIEVLIEDVLLELVLLSILSVAVFPKFWSFFN